jgi:hypothetical protein
VINFLKNIVQFILASIIGYVLLLIVWGEFMPRPLKKNLFNNIGGYGHTFSRLKEIKKLTNVDILFLGSSHTYRTFDNRFFEIEGLKIFNLGTNAQTAIQTEVLLERHLKRLKPKIVIYEVYPGNLSSDGIESAINILNNDKIDFNALKMALSYNHIKTYNALIFSIYSDLINKKIKYKEPNKKYGDTYISGGYVEKELKLFAYKKHKKRAWILDEKQIKLFEKNIELIKTTGAKLILVQAPITKNLYNAYSNNDYYDSLISTYGDYYNFNKIITIDDSLHFYDHHHLNQKGVELFNKKFIDDLGDKIKP